MSEPAAAAAAAPVVPVTAAQKTSFEDDVISSTAMMMPLAAFLYAHKRGLTVKTLTLVYNTVGVWGFPFLPLLTISFEKCIYDSVRSLQGYDPKVIRDSRKGEGWPSGGAAALPNMSLFPVRKIPGHAQQKDAATAAAATTTATSSSDANTTAMPGAAGCEAGGVGGAGGAGGAGAGCNSAACPKNESNGSMTISGKFPGGSCTC